jgi:hypothetical protein
MKTIVKTVGKNFHNGRSGFTLVRWKVTEALEISGEKVGAAE